MRRPIATCRQTSGAFSMMDVIMLALGLSLFAATIAYAYACERL
jgi:hypothetical protein